MLLLEKGELDRAFQILTEDVIPIAKQMGNVRSVAVSQRLIAQILEERGEETEALRIYREEVVPLLERIGDVREKAVAMLNISGILKSQGLYDEALQLCHDEVLPVVQALGDAAGIRRTLNQMFQLLIDLNDKSQALLLFTERRSPAYDRFGWSSPAVSNHCMATLLLVDVKGLKAGIDAMRNVLTKAEEFGDASQVVMVCELLANLYYSRNEGADRRRCRELVARAFRLAEENQLSNVEHLRQLWNRHCK